MSYLVENLLTGQVFRAQEITDLDAAVRLQATVGDVLLHAGFAPDNWHIVPEHVFAEAYAPVEESAESGVPVREPAQPADTDVPVVYGHEWMRDDLREAAPPAVDQEAPVAKPKTPVRVKAVVRSAKPK